MHRAWDIGVFSCSPDYSNVSQAGGVKKKALVPTARDFDSVSLGLGYEFCSFRYLGDSNVQPDLGGCCPSNSLSALRVLFPRGP